MGMITTTQYRDTLFEALRHARENIHLASAYITAPGIEAILQRIEKKNASIKVLARWDAHDLASGASDIEVYEKLRMRGYPFYINQRLHGKFALIDDDHLFIGSANFTASGLQLGIRGNEECGTVFKPNTADIAMVRNIFDDATQVTPSLYEAIRQFIDSVEPDSPYSAVIFPVSIMEQFHSSIEGLWVRELLWTDDPLLAAIDDPDVVHDRLLLNVTFESTPSVEWMGSRFQEMRCCRWLLAKLREHNGQLYFGEATALLHDALLEDPKPYRKDVKILLRNLLTWAKITLPQMILVDAPQHSQRIRLIS